MRHTLVKLHQRTFASLGATAPAMLPTNQASAASARSATQQSPNTSVSELPIDV